MKQKLFENVFNVLYPDLKIVSYELWVRHKMIDDDILSPMSPAIFIEVTGGVGNVENISEDISRMIGHDVVVDKIG